MALAPAKDTALVLAPHGRDAALLRTLLSEVGIAAHPVTGLRELVAELDEDTGFVVLAEEAMHGTDPRGMSEWLARQAEWSDLPFIMLTAQGGGLERNPVAARHLELLGNVTFLERPFHPTTLVSLARAARRGRRRQWEARTRLEATRRASIALGESEGMLREAQELAGIGSWRFDHEKGIGRVSRSYRKLHFLSSDSNHVTVSQLLEVMHPDDRAQFLASAQRGLISGERTVVEYRVVAADGQIRWIRGVGHTSDTNRPATISSGIVEDVTERVLTREALAKSEAEARASLAQLDQLYATAPVGLGLLNRELRFERINGALAAMNGWTAEDHIGKAVWEIVPDLRDTAEPILRRVLETGEPLTDVLIEGFTDAQPGVLRQWREQFYPMRSEAGDVVGIGIIAEEETDKQRLQRIIADREAHLRRVLDQLFAFVGTLTPEGIMIEVNRAPLETGGIAREDVIGKPFWQAHWWNYAPEVQARLRDSIARAREGETVRYDVSVQMAGGARMAIDFQLSPMRNENGDLTHLIASGVLIDDRLAAEAELRALNTTLEERIVEEVERRATAQKAMLQAQKMEALGQLTSGIAHDFNNVLAAIASGFKLIDRWSSEERVKDIARHSLAASQRGGALVKQLLAFARQQTIKPERVDVGEVLTQALPLLERAVSTQHKVSIDCPCDLGEIEVDAGLLESALINLVINARDAMPAGGEIAVTACRVTADDAPRAETHLVQIAVHDTGEGMPPEVVARVTEPFFTTKKPDEGTGLGLAMVHGFVEQSGGSLQIESVVGEGTVISLLLPLAAALRPEKTRPMPVITAAPTHRLRVLLVEDDAVLRMFMAAQITELGHDVVIATDGSDALDKLKTEGRIDVIVSDVQMPHLDGLGLARAVRKTRPAMPFLFITGQPANPELAGERVLTKPFEEQLLDEFLASVKAGGLEAGSVMH